MARTPKPVGGHLPNELVDTVDKTFRRLRKATVKPPAAQMPMTCLGHPLDMAKIFACDAVSELADGGTAVTVKDVALALDLEHSTVSRLLGELHDDGLIVRGMDPVDRRRTTVELTDLGREVVAEATTLSRFFTRILLAEWTRDEVDELARVMARLAATIQERLPLVPQLAAQEACGDTKLAGILASTQSPADIHVSATTPPRGQHR
jgi:DNA-binding MarR family transcriptional regulator